MTKIFDWLKEKVSMWEDVKHGNIAKDREVEDDGKNMK